MQTSGLKIKEIYFHKIQVLTSLKSDFIFYRGAHHLLNKIHSTGLPICKPSILNSSERNLFIKDGYNINLALYMLLENDNINLKEKIIKNNILFNNNGRIMIITGPTRGGKTTYLQSIGLIHLLAQAGLFIPAKTAKLSPADSILTHFPIEEKPDQGIGRLGDEALRLNNLFNKVSKKSLVLLNENFSSTSPGEGIYLAQDIIKVLKKLGTRTAFATHLHDLALNINEMNNEIQSDSKIISMVSEAVQEKNNKNKYIKRTFKINQGNPKGKSYANEIAEKFGISYNQLIKLFE